MQGAIPWLREWQILEKNCFKLWRVGKETKQWILKMKSVEDWKSI